MHNIHTQNPTRFPKTLIPTVCCKKLYLHATIPPTKDPQTFQISTIGSLLEIQKNSQVMKLRDENLKNCFSRMEDCQIWSVSTI